MKASLKRFSRLLTVALSAVAIGSLGSLWVGTQRPAFAQVIQPVPGSEDSYLLSYYDVSTAFGKSEGGYGGPGHSGGSGDALVRIVNAGNFTNPALSGDICANIYVFNDVQEMEECCSCDLSPNALLTLSTMVNLTSNPLIGTESTEAGVIKIVGVPPISVGPGETSICPTSETFPTPEEGLHAWTNHTEAMASNQSTFNPSFGFITKTSVDEFQDSDLDSGELNNLFTECEFINQHGSGHGICTCGPPPPPPIEVSVAYANNFNSTPPFPGPTNSVGWLGSAGVTPPPGPAANFFGFVGAGEFDGGGILIQNTSATESVVVNGVTVDFNQAAPPISCTVGTGTTIASCPTASVR